VPTLKSQSDAWICSRVQRNFTRKASLPVSGTGTVTAFASELDAPAQPDARRRRRAGPFLTGTGITGVAGAGPEFLSSPSPSRRRCDGHARSRSSVTVLGSLPARLCARQMTIMRVHAQAQDSDSADEGFSGEARGEISDIECETFVGPWP
jgi:hypothetical protein